MRSTLRQVHELAEDRIVRWKASQERFRDADSVGCGDAEMPCLSKPVVYVEGSVVSRNLKFLGDSAA
jgi:hypothetical protein